MQTSQHRTQKVKTNNRTFKKTEIDEEHGPHQKGKYGNFITVVGVACIWDFFQQSCLLSEKTARIVITVGVLIQNTLVSRCRRGRDRMVVEVTTTYAISVYHH